MRSGAHTMNLPPRPPRRHESRDITRPVEIALNAMPGVQVWVNVTGVFCLPNSPGRVRVGLGVGGADIVGLVQCAEVSAEGMPTAHLMGRFFALELKLPSRRQSPPQAAWAAVVRAQGGFYAVARTIPEAAQAVARCREGRSE